MKLPNKVTGCVRCCQCLSVRRKKKIWWRSSSGHRLVWWGGCDVDLQPNLSQDHIA